MKLHRYIHLSDIHFGQENNGNIQIHDDVRQELQRDCSKMRAQLGDANGILVTGDIVYSGKSEEYKIAGEWLDSLSMVVGCEETSIQIVPGNHDINIDKIGANGNTLHETIRNKPIEELDNYFATLLIENEDHNPLLVKLSGYLEFAKRYGCDFISSRPFWVKDITLLDSNKLNFVGLTSVLVSDLSDEIENMILGNKQYIQPRHDNTEFIIMMHHPLDWFRDREEAQSYLKRARIILVGHEHEFHVHLEKHGDNHTLWVHSGATNPEDPEAPYQYRYNWLELSNKIIDDKVNLNIRIFPRIWDNGLKQFQEDIMITKNNHFVEYNLVCPNYHPQIKNNFVDMDSAESIPKKIGGQEVQIMSQESMELHEDPYIKLRYLFWKYLVWQERLSVLVELKILPKTQETPIPQTIEQLALERAREEGNLAILWDSIMRYIPEEQREPNPF